MLDQSYSESNLRRLLHPIDFVRYKLTNDKFWIKTKLEQTSEIVDKKTIEYDAFDVVNKRQFSFFKCNLFETDILLRKLDNNVKRLYKIKQSDRTEIVKQVKAVLSDETPITIVRLDVKSFYESIDRDRLLKKINTDHLLSSESKEILNNLFNNKFFKTHAGLPRGIGISATLSELYMRGIDKDIKRIPGVIYYARYVDDMLIATCNSGSDITKIIEDKLSFLNLHLNSKKCTELSLPQKGRQLCSCIESCTCKKGFEYLGYKFSFPRPESKKDKKRFVSIALAKAKENKIKSRIINSFLSHAKSKDFYLLEKRLQYLTGNYIIPLSKTGKELYGGVYYHYPLITDFSCLNNLTVFLRKILYTKSGRLGRIINKKLSGKERKYLLKYAFEGGYKKRIIHKFNPKDISNIKECWRYE